jgi:hypothetical protein
MCNCITFYEDTVQADGFTVGHDYSFTVTLFSYHFGAVLCLLPDNAGQLRIFIAHLHDRCEKPLCKNNFIVPNNHRSDPDRLILSQAPERTFLETGLMHLSLIEFQNRIAE